MKNNDIIIPPNPIHCAIGQDTVVGTRIRACSCLTPSLNRVWLCLPYGRYLETSVVLEFTNRRNRASFSNFFLVIMGVFSDFVTIF